VKRSKARSPTTRSRTEATFLRSAAGRADFPRDGAPELALVGRSNVGKSSLINALAQTRVARTSAAPGKTRLINIYRVRRGAAAPFYLVDLPGYGYARGGAGAARAFDELTRGFFERIGQGGQPARLAALLLVDARHPGMDSDRQAWSWLKETVAEPALVAAKIDKLARGERIRALSAIESAFDEPALPVSATTGEGLEELWKLIDRLLNRSTQPGKPHRKPRAPTDRPLPPSSASTSRR
jgi:GTP-binding protein